MADLRCAVCDRPVATTDEHPTAYTGTYCRKRHAAGQWAAVECIARAVDWRTRALDAEVVIRVLRAALAEARRAGRVRVGASRKPTRT